MKYLKILGLAAMAAMALMAFAGASSASATILTCTNSEEPPKTIQCPKGTVIDASVEGGTIRLTGTQTITCPTGTVKGEITVAGSSTETVKGKTTEVTFPTAECTPSCTAIEVTNGELEVHTDEGEKPKEHNGTLTASGFTAHIVCSGVTCNYITGNNLHMGTVTGSSNLGGKTATIDIDATLTKQAGSSFLCTQTATWEGSYTVTTPDWLDVD